LLSSHLLSCNKKNLAFVVISTNVKLAKGLLSKHSFELDW